MGIFSDTVSNLLNPNTPPAQNVIVPTFFVAIVGGPEAGRYAVVLNGYCLPFQDGSVWQSKTQSIRTWYPGNPEASVQVIGPQEGSSTFQFKFDRHRMGTNPGAIPPARTLSPDGETIRVLTEPLDLCETFKSLCLKGMELQVTWGALDRRGILVDVSVKPRHEGWVDCNLTFDWHAAGEFTPSRLQPPFSWTGAGKTLLSELTGFVDVLNNAADTATEFLDDIDSCILQIDASLTEYITAVNKFAALPGQAKNMAQNLVSAASLIGEGCRNLGETLDADFQSLGTSNPGDMTANINMLEVIAQGQKSCQTMQATAKAIQDAALALFGGDDVLAVEVAYAGATLTQYAKTYYGDPALWTVIAKANLWTSPQVQTGAIVVIPRRTV